VRRLRSLLLVLTATAVLGCAMSVARRYQEAHSAASRAWSAGRFDEAAQAFAQAASVAQHVRDRDEMLFMEASSYERGGRLPQARAAFTALEKLNPSGERASRASFELAAIEIQHGNRDRGDGMMKQFVRRYPNSGLAGRALTRTLARMDETSGPGATLAYLQANMDWLKANDLGEQALYAIAERYEQLGQIEVARNQFVTCAISYPYPYGALFDDALYRASELDEKLGDPKLAIAHLRQMLSVRERASLNGTYERPRFAQAQMRIAVVLRDALQDRPAARRELRRLFDEFETSLLRDEALWEEAKLALRDKGGSEACDAMGLLVRKLPDSRYAPCARFLCPTAQPPKGARSCHRYIERDARRATDGQNDAAGSPTP
jgi:tetratricopeptide (TPR) repeat protein